MAVSFAEMRLFCFNVSTQPEKVLASVFGTVIVWRLTLSHVNLWRIIDKLHILCSW